MLYWVAGALPAPSLIQNCDIIDKNGMQNRQKHQVELPHFHTEFHQP